MQAVGVGLLRVRVTLGAGNFLRGGLVDRGLYILMAIDAGKHAAVDGVLQLALIHIQADLLAIHLRRHRSVRVADETVAILGLLLGACRTDPNKQGQHEHTSENSASGVHDLEKMLKRESPL
jgi:hypothetical protein